MNLLRKNSQVQNFSETIGNYLLELIRSPHYEWNSTSNFANLFDVHPSTVTEHFQKLADLGLVKYERYKGVKLTELGIKEGELLIWKHRILETFFSNYLGLLKEDACKEASKIDFFISENIISLICKKFNHPNKCPCGFEITKRFCNDK
ncbi:MAG: metal-dependent transcriptional regulator [Candidatus Lokiarchaeota archaeon]|nr:metal-dependent transcriptional regulator [Candidatus Lokiarchaeota archaeon]